MLLQPKPAALHHTSGGGSAAVRTAVAIDVSEFVVTLVYAVSGTMCMHACAVGCTQSHKAEILRVLLVRPN